MPVVEPQVDREKLAEVLAEGSESEVVEFKRSCNLDERHDIVMLAAGVGAMQMPVDGGYIGLGFHDDGSVADGLSEAEARLLDPATIRDKLLPYLPEPLELLAAVHEIDGKRAGLIYVAPSSDGFSIFEKDGSYYDAKGQEQRRFRAGEVFARHGTASERWNQRDIARIRQRLVEQERERWAVELRRDLPNLGLAAEAQQLSEAPAAALVWQMDGETFVATVIEQLRRGDDVPLSLLLTSLPVEAATQPVSIEGAIAQSANLDDEEKAALAAMYRLLVNRSTRADRSRATPAGATRGRVQAAPPAATRPRSVAGRG